MKNKKEASMSTDPLFTFQSTVSFVTQKKDFTQ
jgi:hypothetical protein